MYDLEFVHAATGETIGTAARERGVPAEGGDVVLEHAILGPVRYRVTRPAEHWYRSRAGRHSAADQYTGVSVKVYVVPAEARP